MKCTCGSGVNEEIERLRYRLYEVGVERSNLQIGEVVLQEEIERLKHENQGLFERLTELMGVRKQLTRQKEGLAEEITKLHDRAQEVQVDDFASFKLRELGEELKSTFDLSHLEERVRLLKRIGELENRLKLRKSSVSS